MLLPLQISSLSFLSVCILIYCKDELAAFLWDRKAFLNEYLNLMQSNIIWNCPNLGLHLNYWHQFVHMSCKDFFLYPFDLAPSLIKWSHWDWTECFVFYIFIFISYFYCTHTSNVCLLGAVSTSWISRSIPLKSTWRRGYCLPFMKPMKGLDLVNTGGLWIRFCR